MRKGLIFLLSIVSFLGINTVSAEEIYLEYETNVNEIKPYIDEIGIDNINKQINSMINYYNDNLSQDHSYYFIHFSYNAINYNFRIYFTTFTQLDYSFSNSFNVGSSEFLYKLPIDGDVIQIISEYNSETSSFLELDINYGSYSNPSIIKLTSESKLYNPYNYYYSNFDLYYKGSLLTDDYTLNFLNQNDNLNLPYLDGSNKYYVYKANSDFIVEPYYLYDGNSSLKDETYVAINLNDYSYVALSLKDYNTIPENNSSVYTNLYVKGQLCITPVYNYGQTERKDILTGTQVQGCSQYYNDFTLTRMYILKDDVENHAIYYLKAYNTSKENYVKVDTSKFYITYITEDKKDNPEVLINGKIYPTLSYDSLTDTSTKSEDEGYTPGVSCAVGDFNCYNEYSSENIFDEVFSSPLDFLKNIWSSVTSIFDIITEFISLLPLPMQSFLYLSFMVAVAFGLIKLIL